MSESTYRIGAALDGARTRLAWGAARSGRGVTILEEVGDELAALAHECGVDSPLGRKLAAVSDGLASHVLAVAGLEEAGVPVSRREALVERGRNQAAGELEALLETRGWAFAREVVTQGTVPRPG